MLSPCPFMQWGMDIVSPFPLAAGQKNFLLVAIDFTKWVEAEPLTRITEGEVEEYKNGVKACTSAKIHHSGSSSSQREVEVTNRILIQGIKRRLERVGENWAEELTSVLWAYRTTPRGSTGESPFSLVYGTEAIIPAELGIPSHRVMNFSEESGSSGSWGPEEVGGGGALSDMATGAGGSLEGPSGRSARASSFFSYVFPSLETPPSEESIAAAGG
ncbi:UNVERIFIED_CONTAM: hypothetical protein Slati_2111500 [Sesamum latifolium]|uniref:Uncharacterized protein n=1 Tax=Sesamum latifolium TaxID=2727402 RepID=A0AAW2WQW4_9LAMI